MCESPLTAPMLHQAAASVNLSLFLAAEKQKTKIWTKRVFNNKVLTKTRKTAIILGQQCINYTN